MSTLPPDSPYPILYSDEALFALNKPPGLVVHPTYKHPDSTMTDAVFAWLEGADEPRPWLMHRLDKDTSGVTLFARTDPAQRAIAKQFSQRRTHKRYLALTVWPEGDELPLVGEVDAPLWRDPEDRRRVIIVPAPVGQFSQTRYRALATASPRDGERYALVLAEPITGRTHQVRAHLTSLGAPLVGDTMYLPEGSPVAAMAPRCMLHAWTLTVHWPHDTELTLTAPPPEDMLRVARELGLSFDPTLL